jgi:hypothetical protein
MVNTLKKIYNYLDDFYWWNHRNWLRYIIEDRHGRLRLSSNWFRAVWFRIRNGWDSSDTWSLQFTISKFILPRLKYFKKVNNGIPNGIYEKHRDPNRKVSENTKLALEEWNVKLDKMILAFQRIIDEDEDFHDWKDKKYWDKQEKIKKDGLKLFAKYFEDLWW